MMRADCDVCLLISLAGPAIGLLLLVRYLRWERRFTRGGVRTVAEVIGHERREDPEGDGFNFHPIFEIRTDAGEMVTITSASTSYYPPMLKTGARVAIYYRPDDLSDVVIARFRWMVPAFVIVFSAFWAVGATQLFPVR